MPLDISKVTVQDLLNADEYRRLAEAEVTDLYHILEYCTLDAVALIKTARALRSSLVTRRVAKEIKAIAQQIDIAKFNPRTIQREENYKEKAQEAFKKLKQSGVI